jgi:hypothetical protein
MYINRGPISFKRKFDKVFEQNLFHGDSSKSGNGSSRAQTAEISYQIPSLVSQLNISSILDLPCGDLEWMKHVDINGANYIGGDVSPSLISHLKLKFPDREFQILNITKDVLPKVELIFCRDLFVHLSDKKIKLALKNIKSSKSTYLATTTFTERASNKDLPLVTRNVAWRPINLELAPFLLPSPIKLINEKCTEGDGAFEDKSIGIWKIADLN